MNFKSIEEHGSHNILTWAIQHEADVRNDSMLQSLINEQLYFSIKLENVNFFELLSLGQMYRNKLRIDAEHVAKMPLRKDTVTMFPGSFTDESNPDTTINNYEIAEESIKGFLNLVDQMWVDEDIIRRSAVALYLPMITRTFDVRIPISFIDFINCLPAEKTSIDIFSKEYPATLNEYMDSDDFKISRDLLLLPIIKNMSIPNYSKRMEILINTTKYAGLKINDLISYKMISFYKYDPISRNEIRGDFFNSTKEQIESVVKKLSSINTPLKIDFAVSLPLQNLCNLFTNFDSDVLPIKFTSSMTDVISNGIAMDLFSSYEIDENDDDELLISKYENAVEEYKNRITEANTKTLTAIKQLLDNDSDRLNVFALLPSIYKSKAVITLSADKQQKYIDTFDADVTAMFSGMMKQMNSLQENINRYRIS